MFAIPSCSNQHPQQHSTAAPQHRQRSHQTAPVLLLRRRRWWRLPQALRVAAAVLLMTLVGVAVRPCAAYAVRQQVNGNNGITTAAECPADRLVAYKVVMHTYWTRELFPKHYPDWRPTPQWTKTVGRSHDGNFNMFSLGKPASAALKAFAETGRSDGLEQRSAAAGAASVLDDFQVPAIAAGGGRSEARLFVDSNHTLVSMVTRMVPSPDWFVGVDSFQLCVGGSWMDSVTVELDPLDAGTDNGFTFTAPNWPTDPPGVIYRMTSHYPAHQASSFYYPQSKRLPPIATFQFIKQKEFELSEVFRFAEDNRRYDTVQTNAHLDAEHNQVDMNNELSADIEQERQHEMAGSKPARMTEKDRIRAKMLARINQSTNLTTFSIDDINDNSLTASGRPRLSTASLDPVAHAYIVPSSSSPAASNRTALLASIAQRYATNPPQQPTSTSTTVANDTSRRRKAHHHRKRVQRPGKDCRVGHWSDWSGCSQTCGIGEMQRHRKVIRAARRGGRACPPLQESRWCGSARDCNTPETYFKW